MQLPERRRTRAALLFAGAIGAQLLSTAPVMAQPVLGGFQGSWVTVDCADSGGGSDPDCGVWGDGSRLTMQVGFGKSPKVSIKDDRSTACLDAGAGARWTGSGTGWYTQEVGPDGAPGPIYLHVLLAKAGCGSLATLGDLGRDMAPGDGELVFYHDLGSDTIWFDPDGLDGGLDWHRSN